MATEMEAVFARQVVQGVEPIQAALSAGYSESTAKHGWSRLLRAPSVVEIITVELERARLEGGIIGFNTLRTISRSDKAPAAARVTAARTLMEYAGMIGRTGQAEKDPADMSTEELRQLLGRIDTEIVSRAKPVNAPIQSPIPSQVIDLID